MDIRIAKDARSGVNYPEIQVRFKSAFLWRHGWQKAIKMVDDWIRSWAEIKDIKISRLDLAVDFMGALPVLSSELTEVVTRIKKKKGYCVSGQYNEGWDRIGYTFGEKDLMGRIYDKRKEIGRSDKKWFEPLWKANGWEQGNPVTRVEFQIRRKIIKQMGICALEDLNTKIPGLWEYLSEEWLSIRVVGKDSHRTRWAISDFWLMVQSAAGLFGNVTEVSRLKQLKAKGETLRRLQEGMSLTS